MARRKTSHPQIELRHRLPNPPALYVGRRQELVWLCEALERSAVVLLCGPGGIGKTATALECIHRSFPQRVDGALYVSARPSELTAQVRHTLVRLLGRISGSPVKKGQLKGDPEALTTLAIDLAEQAEAWVVIDDVHHADAEEMNELLTQLSTYARQSRWIVTSRVNPALPPLASQVLELGAMDERDLEALAQALDRTCSAVDIRRSVASSAGSPWLLQQHVSGGATTIARGRDQLLADLPDDGAAFVRALSVLHRAFPLELVGSFAVLPSAETVKVLERRGIIQRERAGYRLHDVVRGFLFPAAHQKGATTPEKSLQALREKARVALAQTGEPAALLESARLALELGQVGELAALLDTHGERLIDLGFAPSLWVTVGEAEAEALHRWQLRCAVELGNPTVLDAVDEPLHQQAEDTLAWAATVYAQGDIASALAFAAEAQKAASSNGGEETTYQAALLVARCRLHQGQGQMAQEELGKVIATTAQRIDSEALGVLCGATLGERGVAGRALKLAKRNESGGASQQAALDVANALHLLARKEAASEVLDAVFSTPRGGRASLFVARQALLLRARILAETGELERGREVLDSVAPYTRGSSLLRPFLLEIGATIRLAAGDLKALGADIQTGLREAARVDQGCFFRCAALLERLRSIQGERRPCHVEPGQSADGRGLALAIADRAARQGQSSEHGALPPDSHVDMALFRATHALLQEDHAAAVEHARAAVDKARRSDDPVAAALGAQALCEALLCSGRLTEIRAGTDELAEVAQRMGSDRFNAEALFYDGRHNPATLERLAAGAHVAPVAARRAQALLGGCPDLDLVDSKVIAAIRADRSTPPWQVTVLTTTTEPGRFSAGWGLDDLSHSVWLPSGKTVDLSGRAVLWRFLVTLAELGGEQSKETLVCRVWGESEYHPLRHDSRLHVTIRNIRTAIEDDPSTPTRLLTTEEGYRLGGVLRRRRAQ